jgi:hypothetical protein
VHLLAVLTRSAISAVDAEPTYDLIPKNEIIRHMQSPHLHYACRQTGAYQRSGSFHMQEMICALTLGMAGGYAVHGMFVVMGWH